MSLPIILQPDARVEYDEAFDWMESRWSGSGVAFADAIQAVFDRIAANPQIHAKIHGEVRRAVVRGYRYYNVYYREESDHIEVLSVFHTSRDPRIWQGRA